MKKNQDKNIKTLKVRIKDKHTKHLREMAADVDLIWNFINHYSCRQTLDEGIWPGKFSLNPILRGASAHCSLNAQTIIEIAIEHSTRRKQFKRWLLNDRKTHSPRRSRGWIPLTAQSIQWRDGKIIYQKQGYNVWDSYGLGNYKWKAASFNEDARGRWYFNVSVEVPRVLSKGTREVGLNLGIINIAALSDGEKLTAKRWYYTEEERLACAQRNKKNRKVRAIHAKIANRRKDALHKFSTALVKDCHTIYIGGVESLEIIAKNKRLAKSTYDSGWYMLKTMLEYKCRQAGVYFAQINEAYTTQVCSNCKKIPESSPKGEKDLNIREWTCELCGVHHDRDLNSAYNILSVGREHRKAAA